MDRGENTCIRWNFLQQQEQSQKWDAGVLDWGEKGD